jgi:tRNA(Ile)-lysidine synthase
VELSLKPGRYILAISGGIDSAVLLDLASKLNKNYEFVVAHFDHGIRDNSTNDAKFVENLAKKYNFEFESERVELGAKASEAEAREARYLFLNKISKKHNAQVVTAHHRDDVIETCLIQMIRGTGWRGLAGMSNKRYLRPLTSHYKSEIVDYALKNNLLWTEDQTNESFDYLRNRVRNSVTAKLNNSQKQKLYNLWQRQCQLRDQIDLELDKIIAKNSIDHEGNLKISRYLLIMTPVNVAREIIRSWLILNREQSLTRPILDKICLFARTARSGKILVPNKNIKLLANLRFLVVISDNN